MFNERTFISVLICLAGAILGPYLLISSLEGNPAPFMLSGGLFFLLFSFFFLQNRLCAFPLLGMSIPGKFNFLPFGLSSTDIFSFVLILYFLISYIALRQKKISIGQPAFFWPIFVIAMIVLYHDHDFGLHVFGSAKEGSRPGLFLMVAMVAYVCGINLSPPPITFLHRLPWYGIVLAVVAALPFILTTYIPSLAPAMYYLTDNINISAYQDSVSDSSNINIVRAGAQAGIGAVIQVFLLAYFPIYTWWRPNRWPVLVLSLCCCYLVISGGYRSGLMMFGVVTVAGAACYGIWRALLIVPAVFITILGLSLAQENHIVNLSLTAQRSLSFVPGTWDREVLESASSSNGFRDSIQKVYMHEYFFKSPLIGNGFTFDPAELDATVAAAQRGDPDGYYLSKGFIITKTFHVGWISLYDAVGVIGGVAFIALGANLLLISGRFVFARGVDRNSHLFPLKVWLFCNIFRDFVAYFTVFGNFGTTLGSFLAYGIILSQLIKIDRKSGPHVTPPLRQELEMAQLSHL